MAGLYWEYNNNNKYRYPGGYIHPGTKFLGTVKLGRNVTIEEGCEIGDGCFLGHNAIIRPRTIMGENSQLRAGAWLANDVKIGKNTYIFNNAIIGAGSEIGDFVYFGPNSITINTMDIVLNRDRELKIEPVKIKDGARIASSVTILPGLILGENCLIGAGSLVNKNIPDNQIWFGHPAKYQGDVGKFDIPKQWKE